MLRNPYLTRMRQFSTLHLYLNLGTGKGSSNRWLNRQKNDIYVKQALEEGYRCRSAYKLIQLDDKFHFFSEKKNKSNNNSSTNNDGLVVVDCGARPGGWTQVALEKVTAAFKKSMKSQKSNTIPPTSSPSPFTSTSSAPSPVTPSSPPSTPTTSLLSVTSIDPNQPPNKNLLKVQNESGNRSPTQPPPKRLSPLVIAMDIESMDPIPGAIVLSNCDITDPHSHSLISKELNGRLIDILLSDMAPPAPGSTSLNHLQCTTLVEYALYFGTQHLKPGGWFICKTFRGQEDRRIIELFKSKFASVQFYKPPATRKESNEIYIVASSFREKLKMN